MQRNYNFTSRQKVNRDEVSFSFVDAQASPLVFNVVFNFEADKYSKEAHLFIEAHVKETRQRFDFGTISQPTSPDDLTLDKLDPTGNPIFEVLIVDQHGSILAIGNGMKAYDDDDKERRSAIAVLSRPLDQLSWKVDIEKNQQPELIINSRIPDFMEKIKSNALYRGLIIPAVMKQVLTCYLLNNDSDDTDDEDRYRKQWLELAEDYNDQRPDEEDSMYTKMNWLDDVITNFCTKHKFSDQLIDQIKVSKL